MNRSEEMVKQKYEKLGWTLVHGGAPDFLAFKKERKEIKILFIEVKTHRSKLEKEQSVWKEVLEKGGLNFKLERVGKRRLDRIEDKEKIIIKNICGICEHLNLPKQYIKKTKETAYIILKRIPTPKIAVSASIALLSLLFNDIDVTIGDVFRASKTSGMDYGDGYSPPAISQNVKRICSCLGFSFPKTNRPKVYYAQLKRSLKNSLYNINLKNGCSDVLPSLVIPNTIDSKN
jgi:hypothetical protein